LKLRPGDGVMLTIELGWTTRLATALKQTFLLVFVLYFYHATLIAHLAHLGLPMRWLLDNKKTTMWPNASALTVREVLLNPLAWNQVW
jgi:hypothetical protein